MATLGLRSLQAIGFQGVAEVEIKRDARNGILTVLEINSRSWIQNQLAYTAEVDLDYLAYADAAGLPLPLARRQLDGLKWIAWRWDLRAAWNAVRAGELTTVAWLRSLRSSKVVAYWSWSDPVPFAWDAGRFLRDIWNAIARRLCEGWR